MRPDLKQLFKNLNVPTVAETKPDRQKTESEKTPTADVKKNVSEAFSKAIKDMGLDTSLSSPFTSGSKYNSDYIGTDVSYDFGEIDLEELRAQEQPFSEKWLHGIGRLGAKTLTEFGKGIGYIGGALPAVLNQEIELMTNNFFVNGFQDMDDAAKEAMPVYVRQSVENGSFARQIWSPEFWVTEGADGLGFMLSAILSGGTIGAVSKSLGIGAKIAQILGKGAKVEGAISEMTIAGVQTFMEAAAETKGVVDDLKLYWESRMGEDGLYDSGEVDDQGNPIKYTKSEVDSLIGNSAVSTMGLNMFLLYGPNMIQTKMIFGKSTGEINPFRNIKTGTVTEMQEQLAKRVPWKKNISTTVLKGAESAGAEAFQEWSQFSIENYTSNKGKGLANKGMIDSLVDGYIEGLTTIEGKKSIFLGAVLGLGPGAVGAYKQVKAESAQAKDLLELMSNSTQAFKDDITSVYQKDAEGKIIYKNGEPQIDSVKMAELWDSVSEDMIQSKLYEQAKIDKDINAAKHSLREIITRNMYPYLNVEGGIELWKAHTKEMTSLLHGDAKALGFNTQEQMTTFLRETSEQIKNEYDNVIDKGPSFFGIDSNRLGKNKQERDDIKARINKFVSNLEYNAVRLKLHDNTLKEALSLVERDIQNFESKILKGESIEEDSKKFSTLSENDKVSSILLQSLKEKKKQILKSISENGNLYASIFDKEQQNKAFNEMFSKQERLEKAKEEDALTEERDKEFKDYWYEMLASKGYNVSSSLKDKTNDFGNNTVTLKDDNSDVWRIEKKFNSNTKSPYFILKNLDHNSTKSTKETYPLTVENLKKLGLDKESNILTKQEFQKWLKMNRIANANNIRLSHLKQLISEHTANRHSYREEVKILKDKLEKYNEELQFWLSVDDVSYTEVLDELIRLEENIAEVNREIEFNENNEKGLSITIKSLQQFKSELEAIIEDGNKQELVFTNKLKELEKQLLDGDFDLDLNTIIESIDITKSILDDLYNVKDKLQDTFDDLIDVLSNMNDIELMFDEGVSNKLIELLQEYAPDIEINGNKLVNLTKRQLRHLLHNKNTANTILSELKDNKRELMNAYAVTSQDLADIKSQIKSLRTTLNKLGENKNLLIKYETLDSNIKTLAIRNRIKKDIKIERGLSFNQNNKGKNKVEQNDKDSESQNEEALVRKYNPWTTITSLYKTENGKVVWKNGEKVLHENAKQSIKWSKAVSQIPLDKLSNYSVRFVNAEQLGELLKGSSEEVPVVSDSALYAVIYDNSTQMPINVGGLIYTGIAEPSTYFREDGRVTIDVTRMPAYMSLFSRDINENNPVTFKNESYNNRESLLKAVENFIKEDYIAWRQEVLDNIKDGNLAVSAITDISKGIGRYSKTKFNKPKDVLNIKSLRVARGSNMSKSNGREGLIEVENGMVYAELDNGQMQRLLNIKIGNLPEAQKNAYLNKIVRFMSLAQHLNSKDFKSKFKFAGKSKESISLFGSENKPGILDLFINWGRKKIGEVEGRSIYKDWGIAIYSKDPDNINSPLEIRFDMKDSKGSTVSIKMDFSDIIDAKGNVRDIRHPKLRLLADFLESKFMNVSYSKVGSDKGFKMPKNWTKKGNVIEITYDAYPTYNDYVLDNSLITNIEPKIEGSDKLPQFVNQYATFDRDIKSSFPKSTKEEPTKKGGLGSSLSKKDDAPKKGGLAGSLKNNTSSGGSLAASLRGAQSQPDSEFSKGLLDAYEKEFLEGYQSEKKNDELANYEKMFDNFKENKDFVEPVLQEKDSKKDCGPGKGGIKKPKSNKNRGGLAL